MSKKLFYVMGIALPTLVLMVASCGRSDTTGSSRFKISGRVSVSGSSTVEPISVRVAEILEDSGSKIEVTIDGPGTGDGFKLFCDGETDISNASRAIKDSEAEICKSNGIEWIELQVAIDGIAILTSTKNTAVDCLTGKQLYGLIGPEGEGKKRWNEVDSSLPDESLKIFGPGEESGTFDSFVEIVFKGFGANTTRPDYNASHDDNIIIRGIQSNSGSLGWVGYAFAVEAKDIKLLKVDHAGSGCVYPTKATISSSEYPVARPLFIYINKTRATSNPAVAEYVNFYVSEEGLTTAVTDAKYISLSQTERQKIVSTWNSNRP